VRLGSDGTRVHVHCAPGKSEPFAFTVNAVGSGVDEGEGEAVQHKVKKPAGKRGRKSAAIEVGEKEDEEE